MNDLSGSGWQLILRIVETMQYPNYILAMPTFALLRLQAEKKGASLVVAGLIIAVYQLVCMLASPLIGYHVSFTVVL